MSFYVAISPIFHLFFFLSYSIFLNLHPSIQSITINRCTYTGVFVQARLHYDNKKKKLGLKSFYIYVKKIREKRKKTKLSFSQSHTNSSAKNDQKILITKQNSINTNESNGSNVVFSNDKSSDNDSDGSHRGKHNNDNNNNINNKNDNYKNNDNKNDTENDKNNNNNDDNNNSNHDNNDDNNDNDNNNTSHNKGNNDIFLASKKYVRNVNAMLVSPIHKSTANHHSSDDIENPRGSYGNGHNYDNDNKNNSNGNSNNNCNDNNDRNGDANKNNTHLNINTNSDNYNFYNNGNYDNIDRDVIDKNNKNSNDNDYYYDENDNDNNNDKNNNDNNNNNNKNDDNSNNDDDNNNSNNSNDNCYHKSDQSPSMLKSFMSPLSTSPFNISMTRIVATPDTYVQRGESIMLMRREGGSNFSREISDKKTFLNPFSPRNVNIRKMRDESRDSGSKRVEEGKNKNVLRSDDIDSSGARKFKLRLEIPGLYNDDDVYNDNTNVNHNEHNEYQNGNDNDDDDDKRNDHRMIINRNNNSNRNNTNDDDDNYYDYNNGNKNDDNNNNNNNNNNNSDDSKIKDNVYNSNYSNNNNYYINEKKEKEEDEDDDGEFDPTVASIPPLLISALSRHSDLSASRILTLTSNKSNACKSMKNNINKNKNYVNENNKNRNNSLSLQLSRGNSPSKSSYPMSPSLSIIPITLGKPSWTKDQNLNFKYRHGSPYQMDRINNLNNNTSICIRNENDNNNNNNNKNEYNVKKNYTKNNEENNFDDDNYNDGLSGYNFRVASRLKCNNTPLHIRFAKIIEKTRSRSQRRFSDGNSTSSAIDSNRYYDSKYAGQVAVNTTNFDGNDGILSLLRSSPGGGSNRFESQIFAFHDTVHLLQMFHRYNRMYKRTSSYIQPSLFCLRFLFFLI